MNKLFKRLLEIRGYGDSFLYPKYESLADPFALQVMEKVVSRIGAAIKDNERILIYGDYDVDGVTASTLMEQTLILAGARPENISIMLPDRFADGYGMSPKLIDRAQKDKITLVVTVDCGSRNHAIIDELNALGIDTIVTDHHETADEIPNAVAVVNSHRKDFPTPNLQNLAGVGVAFKVAQALVQKGMIKNGQEKWLLDLVVLGTICDNMSLIGENRILGFYGLKVLAKTRRPGLQELISKARIKNLNAEAVGFIIGPRLNAAGRLKSADLSLNLLRAKSRVDAAPLAEELEQLNKKRKTEQISATKAITARGVSNDPVIVEVGKWHEGILGIVAGHLVEKYHRPAFVLTELDNNILKGSGRSFGDFNLAEALNSVKDTIISGGGHAGAAGVRLDKDNLSHFRVALNSYYQNQHLKNQEQYLRKTADLEILDFSDLDLDFLEDLKLLEPFGVGNKEPIFCIKNVNLSNATIMGTDQNHLRLDLRDKSGKNLKCLSFYAPTNWLNLDPEFDHIEPLVQFVENDFNGIRSLEARIIDINMI